MRAGDDHDGDGAFDGEREVLAHENLPDKEGDHAAPQGNNGEPQRGGVGKVHRVFDLLSWACLTRSMTCDRNESLPVLLISMVNEPSPLMDPPMTFAPVFLVTRDHPR